MHWPSFNAGIITDPAGMHRAVVNTILSLTGSCTSAFMVSAYYNEGKFYMEDILNATLAGGVVIGSACDIITHPFTSLVCGFLAGIISTVGFRKLTRLLEHHIGLFDTAGIHNLHGMPGVLGGILSAIVIAGLDSNQWDIKPSDYGMESFEYQAELQVAATFASLGFGLVAGAFAAAVVKFLPLQQTKDLFEDKPYWVKCVPDPYEYISVSESFNPYGFKEKSRKSKKIRNDRTPNPEENEGDNNKENNSANED